MSGSVAIFGIGNVLTGDDAFGPTLVRQLEVEVTLPPEVSLCDVGTPGLNFVREVFELEVLVAVDTVEWGAAAGALRRFSRDEILRRHVGPRVSPHDPTLREALATATGLGMGPQSVALIGVQPHSLATGIGLSPVVRNALAEAKRMVLDALSEFGVGATPRAVPGTPELFWEADGGTRARRL